MVMWLLASVACLLCVVLGVAMLILVEVRAVRVAIGGLVADPLQHAIRTRIAAAMTPGRALMRQRIAEIEARAKARHGDQ